MMRAGEQWIVSISGMDSENDQGTGIEEVGTAGVPTYGTGVKEVGTAGIPTYETLPLTASQ
jgi:hypothetical protein